MKEILFFAMFFLFSNLKSQTKGPETCNCWQADKNYVLDSSFLKEKTWIKKLPIINQAIENIILSKNRFDIVVLVLAPAGYSERTTITRITLIHDTCFLIKYTCNKIVKKQLNIDVGVIENLLYENEKGKYEYICSSLEANNVVFISRFKNNLFLLDSLFNSYDQLINENQKIIPNFIKTLSWFKPFIVQ